MKLQTGRTTPPAPQPTTSSHHCSPNKQLWCLWMTTAVNPSIKMWSTSSDTRYSAPSSTLFELDPVCGLTPASHDYIVTWRSSSSVKKLCSNASLFSLCRGQNLLFSSILCVFSLRSSECLKGSRRWRASHYLQKGFKSLNVSWGRTAVN